jgi:PAS domain S-box-containing protein
MSQESTISFKGNILVVDDTPANLTLLTRMLSKQGYKVQFAPSGKLALKSIQLTPPDLILLDIIMPEMDGYKVCQELKASSRSKDIPVIFISASNDVFDKMKAFSLGGVDYITKPFEVREVLARVENQLSIVRLSKQLYQENARLQEEISVRKQAEESLRENAIRLRNQNIVLTALARNQALNQGDLQTALKEITEATAQNLVVERVSVWLFDETAKSLQCLDLFELSLNQHSQGVELAAADYPIYFQALTQEQSILADDAHTDPRTREFSEYYLTPLGISSMLDAPIRLGGETVGVLCSEHVGTARHWTPEDQNFVRSIADLVSLALEARERKRAEAALRASEAKFASAFRASPTPIAIARLTDGRFIEVNDCFLLLFGYQRIEVIGHTATELNLWVNLEDCARVLQLVQETGVIRNQELVVRTSSGEVRTVLLSAEILDIDGQVCILATANDITDRQQAEAALVESERKYRDLVETSQDIIWSVDAQGRFTFVNQVVKQIFGYEPEEMLGRSFADFAAPEQVAEDLEGLQYILSGHSLLKYEAIYLAKDSRRIHLLRSSIPKRDSEGRVIGATGTASDITERKLAAEELAERARQGTLRSDISLALTQGGDLSRMLQRFCSALVEHLDAAFARIWTLNPDENMLELQASAGIYTQIKGTHARVPVGSFKIGLIALERQPHLTNDVLNDPDFSNPEWAQREEIVAFAGYPMIVEERLIGVVAIFARHPLSLNTLDVLASIANQMAVGIERKTLERELALREARLNTFFNCAPVGLTILDNQLRFVQINEPLAQMNGLSVSDHIGKTLRELLPDFATQIEPFYQQVLATGELILNQEVSGEKQGQPGVPIHCVASYFPILGEDGSPEGVGTVIVDITERKQALEALRESAKRERAIAQVIQTMRQTLDIDTIFSATTEELRQLLKCDRVGIYRFNPDWSGEFVAESVASGWIALVTEQKNDPHLKQKSLDNENCAVKTFGLENDLVQDTYLQRTQGGAYSRGRSYLAVQDIYQAGFSSCYIHLLERFQARAYITVPIFCGGQLWGLLASYQNSGSRHWGAAEINIVVQIGSQLGVALQQAELLEETQRQAAELREAKEAAEVANRAKTQFLASMSHELRTPLNAILGFTQVMNRDTSLSKEQREHIGIINRSGEHLLELINDILEMSKIEAGRITFHETSFNLYQLLDSLQEMFQLKAQSKGLQLNFERSPDVPQYVQTDEGKLRQVLINLLGNAIKFTESGYITLRVKSVMGNGQKVIGNGANSSNYSLPITYYPLHFEVSDTGPGISPQEIDSLFKAFTQTAAGHKSQGGTGLGLRISRSFVQLMGGDITIDTTLGSGATFKFDIKIKLAQASEIQTTQASGRVIGLAPNQREYRLLVVEDHSDSCQLLVKLLTSIGFLVREASNGQEAVALWESWEPHLILMDMRMPVMDGYEATAKIKSHLKGQATVIIALTASAFEEQRKIILSEGCDDFIGKPFQEKILLEKIAQHLGVQYLYEDSPQVTSIHSGEKLEVLTPEALAVMPPEWRSQLYRAAEACNDEEILTLIEQIPEDHAALKLALDNLVDNFRLDLIFDLTEASANE